MFRIAEDAVVAKLRDRCEARDGDGVRAALTEFWLGADGTPAVDRDLWADEVWRLLEVHGFLHAAIVLGMNLVGSGERVRAASFVHMVQHYDRLWPDGVLASVRPPVELDEGPAQALLSFADHAFVRAWSDDRYVGAVFVKLLESSCEKLLWSHVTARLPELRRWTPTWQLVGVLACCHRSPIEPVGWLSEIGLHPQALPWLRTLGDVMRQPRTEVSALLRGEPAALRDLLIDGRWDPFVAAFDAWSDAGRPMAEQASIATYLNRFKHRFPVEPYVNYEFNREAARLEVVLGGSATTVRVLDLFRELLSLERKRGRRMRQLGSQLRSLTHRNRGMDWARTAWHRVLRERGSAADRLQYFVFG